MSGGRRTQVGFLALVALLSGPGCSDARKEPEPLPDTLSFPSAREREAALVKVAVEQIQTAMAMADPGNILVEANCRLALDEIRLEPPRRPRRPLALAAFIQTIEGRGEFLLVFALNCRRETSSLVVACPGNDGRVVRVVTEFQPEAKDTSLVAELVLRVRFEPLESVVKAAVRTESGDLLSRSILAWALPMTLPSSVPLVVGVVDRSGTASNFVPVIDLRGRANASPMFKGVLGPPATSLPAESGK